MHGFGTGCGEGAKGIVAFTSDQPDQLTQSEWRELLSFLLYPPASLSLLHGFPFSHLGFHICQLGWALSHPVVSLVAPHIIHVLPKYRKTEFLLKCWCWLTYAIICTRFEIYFVFLWVTWLTLIKWISFKWLLQNNVLDILKLRSNMR